MRLNILRDIIGFTLVGLHLIAGGICFFFLGPNMSANDLQLTVLIISPITAIYALAYVKNIIKIMQNPTLKTKSIRTIPWQFAVISVLFTASFSICVIYILLNYPSSSLHPDDLKIRLATIELLLGAFMGLIADTLFGPIEKAD